MAEIIKIDPAEKYFSLTWQLSVRCNYDCMYCPAAWHNNTSPHHSLETLKQTWVSVLSKTNRSAYKISFTGGEPTSSKSFLPFLKWLRTEYTNIKFKILLTTNGSAPYKYYQKLYNYVDNISFSTHSEHIDECKFFDKIIQLHKTIDKTKHLHVNIMNETWNQSRILEYQKILQQHGISNIINEIDYTLQTRSVPVFKGKLNLDIQ